MHRYRRYGITKPTYDLLMKKQDFMCPLCLEPLTPGFNETIDHCHNSLEVRGVLCRGCNMVLSRFEDPGFVARVALYLGGDSAIA
jgi:RNase P subunit RPR2